MHQRCPTLLLCLLFVFGLGLTGGATEARAASVLTFESQPLNGGAPAVRSTIWLAADRMRRDQGDGGTLVRLDLAKMYVLNHKDKTYVELALPLDLKSAVPEAQRALIDQLSQSFQMTAVVAPSAERKEVGGYKARRFDIKLTNPMGLAADVVVWAAPVPGVNLDHFKKLTRHLAGLMPGRDAKWIDELMKVDGIPVVREIKLGTGGSRESLVAAESKDAPAGTFDLPSAYKKVDFNPMTAIGAF